MTRSTVSFFIVLALMVTMIVIGCDEKTPVGSADKVQAAKTAQSMMEAQRQVGMPAIKNFQERKLAKYIFELRDQENLTCYAYIVNLEGKLIYLGKCIGYGLPYSVQFTNPEKLVDAEKQLGISLYQDSTRVHSLPQPDPNGLFMPAGLSATWLMLIDPKTNKPRPVYVEPEIVVSPFPLH